ncbi:MAG: hypothetical protein GDA39_03475 [Hyphomonadaceae bacterium]|nr:hypothetical protein [Hyphomonadaceae bacterium]MBC6412008.1 hypothetical protein [Hyphomonadaceae bacterium]
MMIAPTSLDEDVVDRILEVIRSRFNLPSASDIKVNSIEVDQEEQRICMDLLIKTNKSPEALAEDYFGLTSRVREALGNDWSGFFPIITPQFRSGLYA